MGHDSSSWVDELPAQGDLSNLDPRTGARSAMLASQMRGTPVRMANAPIIWGSIRALSVYGKWSFWRNPKKTETGHG